MTAERIARYVDLGAGVYRLGEGRDIIGTQKGCVVGGWVVRSCTQRACAVDERLPVLLHARDLSERHAVEGNVAGRTANRIALGVAAVCDVAVFRAAEG
jgi:hypothetical protein